MSEQSRLNTGFQSLFDKLDAEHDRFCAAAKIIRTEEAAAAERQRTRWDELACIIINALQAPPHYWGPAVPKTYDLEPVLRMFLPFAKLPFGAEIATRWRHWRHGIGLPGHLKLMLPPRLVIPDEQEDAQRGITFHLLMAHLKKD
jgi:hypothetical protein